MCGVFGFVGRGGAGPDLRRLERIAQATERRGPHAFGFAWVDSAGRLRSFKRQGRITSALGLLSMLGDARLIIGHTRYATDGDPSDNVNNHPHPVDGGWLVHNGVIRNYRRLVDERGLHPSSACDSEVLGLLIEDAAGTMLERCIDTAQAVGSAPLVVLGLWSRPERLVVVRAGNPLCRGSAAEGTYFASYPDGLPANASEVPDGTAISFRPRAGRVEEVSKRFRRSVDRGGALPWYVQ